jgi:hypothetical protein
MGEHAEGVQLATSHRHLSIGKGGATFRHPGAVYHDGGAVAYPVFFVGDELYGLPAIRRLRAEEHRRQTVERDALGTINYCRREIFVT